MKHQILNSFKLLIAGLLFISSINLHAQSNVFDDVIASSPDHTYLKAALEQEGLDAALQNSSAMFTVFAPDNMAFENLADKLGTDIPGLLALSNLEDILLYHVLGNAVSAEAIINGDIVSPLNDANTLKFTKTGMGDVFINQSKVSIPNLDTDNGTVHSVDAVLLPVETVVDVALDNGFSYLAKAAITAELLPALTDPFATYTVFAPTNDAFEAAATQLGTDISGILALPNLADILTYHVLGSKVMSGDITNGAVVDALSMTNTLKLTKKSTGEVYVNQAMVTGVDVAADNGVVHILDAVVLPVETVVDVALDNGFSYLATAAITAELLPALTDPFASYTVFAPTNDAFEALASELGTDINGILAQPNLTDILLYHVVSGSNFSSELENGSLKMLNEQNVIIDLTNGVQVNDATVLNADISAQNGVVHVIDQVLVPMTTSTTEIQMTSTLKSFPNPAMDYVKIKGFESGNYQIHDMRGALRAQGTFSNNKIQVADLLAGSYIIRLVSDDAIHQGRLIKI